MLDMLKLIKFEFRKVLRSKYMYIIFGIGLFITLMSVLLTKAMNSILEQIGESTIPYSGYYAAKGALSSAFSIIGAIFITIFACEDFANQTNKNILAKGYNRLSLFYSKYIVSLLLSLGYALILVLLSTGIGYALYGDGGMAITDNVAVIFLMQLLCVIAYHAFFFFVAYSLGRTGVSIAINILVPMVLEAIVSIVDVIINNPNFKIGDYVIDGIMINISGVYTNTDLLLVSMLLLILYIALSNVFGALIANKKQF